MGKRLVESAPVPLIAGFGAILAAILATAHAPISALIALAASWIVLTGCMWLAQYRAKGATPRLLPTILEAWDEPQELSDKWLVFMRVEIENPDGEPVGIKEWEARLRHRGETYQGQKFQHPADSPRRYFQVPGAEQRRFEYSDFIEHAGQIGARSRISCTLPALFSAPYREFTEVALGVRLRPIVGKWSPWHDFEPPQYPAPRPDPWQSPGLT